MFRISVGLVALLLGGAPAESVAAQSGTYAVLHTFKGGSSGAYPAGDLTVLDGKLYGTTYGGGHNVNICFIGCGTLFSIDLQKVEKSGKARIYSFRNSNGANPAASLLSVGHLLYGTTVYGGVNSGPFGGGVIFAFDPASDREHVAYLFSGGADGGNPVSSLVEIDGVLYGTTGLGGDSNGTVFAFDKASRTERVVLSFNGAGNGAEPMAGLTKVGSLLYGTTFLGGAEDNGTVFSVDPKSGASKVVHSFGDQPDGTYPEGGLLYFQGLLYGTSMSGGGTFASGTVFSIDPTTGTERVVHAFENDGAVPTGRLIAVGGRLYGTTSKGGAYQLGTVFSLDPISGAVTILHSFQGGTDGSSPYAGLTNVGGTLYGTTGYGGTGSCDHGCGTVFSITR